MYVGSAHVVLITYVHEIWVKLPGRWKAVYETELQLQHVQVRYIEHSSIEALVQVLAVSDATSFQETTVPLHHKCPIHPNRTSILNPISDM